MIIAHLHMKRIILQLFPLSARTLPKEQPRQPRPTPRNLTAFTQ